MTYRFVRTFTFLAILVGLAAPAHSKPVATKENQVASPAKWSLTGSEPEAYAVGTDEKIKRTGRASAYLKSKKDPGDEFGTLMQTISAKKFRGKRVRLSAYVKTQDVA